jgi:hypothetical protein
VTTDVQARALQRRLLLEYVASAEFKNRCADIQFAQDQGETFTIEQLAAALCIPEWLMDQWVTDAIQQTAVRVAAPPPRLQ